ncbi:MAG: NAD(P)H-dependent oxidoreductase subunit E [Lentisphaerae bacterium]|nr:NAD(P)H-dependent oxidoreductase subunit E [Lentisphaerota bacterium]
MLTEADSRPLTREVVDAVIARHPDRTGDVLGILEELQEAHPLKYLPQATLELVASLTGVARAQVFSVVTFYAFFNLKPQGRHTVTVCRGTACHTRGSKALLTTLEHAAGVQHVEDEDGTATSFTTPDHHLTVRTVACFGQCALAPVVTVDHAIYGRVTDHKLRKLVAALEERGGA